MSATARFDGFTHRRLLRRWERIAAEAATLERQALSRVRRQAGDLALRLDRVIAEADRRLGGETGETGETAEPATALSESSQIPQSGGDWAWRPAPFCRTLATMGCAGAGSGTALGADVTLFHDCPLAEITLRQTRSERGGAAPHRLVLDTLGFEGTFLSLAVALPEAGRAGLTLDHILRAELHIAQERPAPVYLRLNIEHGPNTERIVRTLDADAGRPATAEFDLAYSDINLSRIGAVWIDIIFERPAMNRIVIDDLVLGRSRRAEF